MEPHSKLKTVFMFFVWFCFLSGAVLIAFYLFLPPMMQRLIPPLIAEKAGIPEVSFTVRHIGLFGADLEAATMGGKSAPGLVIDTIKIDFSLISLLKKEIKKIQLSGIRVFVEYQNGTLTIPGVFPNSSYSAHDDPLAPGRPSNSRPGFSINRIEAANAVAFIKAGDRAIEVPFDFFLLASNSGIKRLTGELKAYPYGQAIESRADIDLPAKLLHLDIAATWLRLDQIPAVSDWIKDFELEKPSARVNVKSEVAFHPEGIKGHGTLHADIGHLSQNQKVAAILAPIRLSGDFHFEIPHDGPWSFAMIPPPSTVGEKPTAESGRLTVGESAISLGAPAFEVFAKGSASGGQSDWVLSIPDFGIKNGSTEISAAHVGFRGTVSWNASKENPRVAVTCLSDPIELKSAAARILIPRLSFDGQFETTPANETRFSGFANFSNVSVFLPSSGAAINGISAQLPLCQPCEASGNPGKFNIASIQWDRKKIGSISGKLKQSKSILEIEGIHRSLLMPGLAVAFTGRSGISSATGLSLNLQYKNLPFKTKTPLDLGRIIPGAAGFAAGGELKLLGDVVYGPFGLKSALTAEILHGTLENSNAKASIKGIEGKIHFQDLISFKTDPQQVVRFSSATFGDIQIQKGQTEFQVESADSIFIEKSGFTWCNGHVDAHALRITDKVSDYYLVLYCDRLSLAMLLEQFGAANADGKGAVNGKIPIRYTNGKLLFEDGFLYSTPGHGGTIKVAQTEKLLAEIPPGAAQSVQMDLAKEALKSYDYTWATLGIMTEGEDLLLQMELSGKPTNPLPFIYRKETGGFVRVQAGEKGSSFQGINLNINFRLPLDKMLQYRKILKMID